MKCSSSLSGYCSVLSVTYIVSAQVSHHVSHTLPVSCHISPVEEAGCPGPSCTCLPLTCPRPAPVALGQVSIDSISFSLPREIPRCLLALAPIWFPFPWGHLPHLLTPQTTFSVQDWPVTPPGSASRGSCCSLGGGWTQVVGKSWLRGPLQSTQEGHLTQDMGLSEPPLPDPLLSQSGSQRLNEAMLFAQCMCIKGQFLCSSDQPEHRSKACIVWQSQELLHAHGPSLSYP